MGFTRTEEQQKTVDLAMEGEDLIVNAFAGASKTTTLTMIANEKHEMGGEVGMYLAFNKAIANEAQDRFPTSVECKTVHSLAYSKTPKALKNKLNNTRVFPKELAEIHGFKAEFIVSTQNPNTRRFITVNQKMSMVNRTVERFCNSADDEISEKHIVLTEWMTVVKDSEFDFGPLKAEILELSKKHWEAIIDPESVVPMTHSGYLKLYSMSNRQIPVDYLMIDENQDSSPVILKIVEAQKKAQKIYVGDRYQAIYGWRGAINAMEIVTGTEVYLTKSFRFGNNVEKIANILLKFVGNNVPLHGNGDDTGLTVMDDRAFMPNAVICRTNAGVIKNIFEYSNRYPNKRVSASCDVAAIESFVRAYEGLITGKKVEHPLLYAFEHKNELMEYCDENPEDLEITGMVKIIEQFGIKSVLASMARCSKELKPDIMITTAHKSKGLEFDNVVINSDYNYDIQSLDNILIDDEELNLIYVACTRAKKNICVAGIFDLLYALSVRAGESLKINDYEEEEFDKVNKVLLAAKVNDVKFHRKGATVEDIEYFAAKNIGLVQFDPEVEELQGF